MKTVWYTARNPNDANCKVNFSWKKYIKWSRLTQLIELVSLDSMLNELSFEPNLDIKETWEYVVTDDGYVTDLFNSAEYVIRNTKNVECFNFLAVVKDPNKNSENLINREFDFVGYELLDESYEASALSNCGGFDETFLPDELNQFGLLNDLDRAIKIQADLVTNNPEEHHAYCNLFGIWRHRTIGRK